MPQHQFLRFGEINLCDVSPCRLGKERHPARAQVIKANRFAPVEQGRREVERIPLAD